MRTSFFNYKNSYRKIKITFTNYSFTFKSNLIFLMENDLFIIIIWDSYEKLIPYLQRQFVNFFKVGAVKKKNLMLT